MEKIALSVAEAAALIGISTKTMYEWIHIDGFPAAKIGGRIIIYYDGLKAWVQKQTEASA